MPRASLKFSIARTDVVRSLTLSVFLEMNATRRDWDIHLRRVPHSAIHAKLAHAVIQDCPMTQQTGEPFRLEEATIDDLHQALRDGRTTCVAVVQRYIDRVRAYNGVSSMLVTEGGEPI